MNQDKSKCAYPGCKSEPLESSKEGYCIFHAKAEEKDIKKFRKALKRYIKHIIDEKEMNYNFRGFIFLGAIHFKRDFEVTVFKNADFTAAEFQGTVSFKGAQFRGKTSFRRAEFQGGVYFWEAEFHEGANFRRAEFRARASISPKFIKREVLFVGANLENTSLISLNLDKNAGIDFGGARLRSTEIRREDIEGHIVQEYEENFSEAKEIYLYLKNNFHTLGRYDDESWAFTKEKELERKSFWHFRKEYKERELGEKWRNKGIKNCFYPALLDCEDAAKYVQDRWLPTSWKKINELFSSVANFLEHPRASIKDELESFVSFMKSNRPRKIEDVGPKEVSKVLWLYMKYPMKYSWSTFLKYLNGWGEWPWLIFLWCGVTIFTFSLFYYLWGDIVITKDEILVKSYLDKLYFSGITFTALGYGDYSPVGGARFLAFLESFLGIFFIALFVFSFARRTAGR